MKKWLALLPILALGACTVGPDYHRPTVTLPPHYDGSPTGTAHKAAGKDQLAQWWQSFHDPVLNDLVTTALKQNLDIRIARARITEARYQEMLAGAQLLPNIGASANASHIHFSKNSGFSSLAKLFSGSGSSQSGGIALPGSAITTYSAGFDASWEIDLFGGKRRAEEAATANVGAAVWSARDAQVSMVAEVAGDYFKLRASQRREQFLRQGLAQERAILKIIDDTASVGLVPGTKSLQIKSQIENDVAQLSNLKAQQRVLIHALAVLLAKPSSQLPPALTKIPSRHADVPPAIPPGLPSSLLRRRPDIRTAERQLAAATARIGVATAHLYPNFSLTGVGELISTALSNLFTSNSIQGVATGAVHFPLLDFGRGKDRVGSARAVAQEAYLNYQKTVIGALRDVDDALVRYRSTKDRRRAMAQRVADARQQLKAAKASYASGLVNHTAVDKAQISLLEARDQQVQSAALQREALISLYMALGGGWQDEAGTNSAAAGAGDPGHP